MLASIRKIVGFGLLLLALSFLATPRSRAEGGGVKGGADDAIRCVLSAQDAGDATLRSCGLTEDQIRCASPQLRAVSESGSYRRDVRKVLEACIAASSPL